MQGEIEKLMQEKNVVFNDLASQFSISKQTLTKKLSGSLAWTFSEMMILAEILEIEDMQTFFFGNKVQK